MKYVYRLKFTDGSDVDAEIEAPDTNTRDAFANRDFVQHKTITIENVTYILSQLVKYILQEGQV